MTNQEATAILDEIRTENPRKRHNRDLYVLNTNLQAKGLPCVEHWRLSKSGKQAVFERMSPMDWFAFHPEIKAWLRSRA